LGYAQWRRDRIGRAIQAVQSEAGGASAPVQVIQPDAFLEAFWPTTATVVTWDHREGEKICARLRAAGLSEVDLVARWMTLEHGSPEE
jgi:hypothetical protein